MKKFIKLVTTLLLSACLIATCGIFGACGNDDKTIKVCASDVPHAEVLNGVVKGILEEQGYTLEVEILDWTIQNDAVATGDYDANYFQHVPYLETYEGDVELFASCKVHYEPLGIYYGKATAGTPVTDATSIEICDDVSNAIRAFQLLTAKGVISADVEGENYPVNADGETLNIGETSKTWTNKAGTLTVTLVAENLLVSSLGDYDFACLPCNTAYTGNVDSSKRAAVEDDPAQVAAKANVIAARVEDYASDANYKAKIDALTDAMLSETVANYFAEKYLGAMTCDASSQIDLRK